MSATSCALPKLKLASASATTNLAAIWTSKAKLQIAIRVDSTQWFILSNTELLKNIALLRRR